MHVLRWIIEIKPDLPPLEYVDVEDSGHDTETVSVACIVTPERSSTLLTSISSNDADNTSNIGFNLLVIRFAKNKAENDEMLLNTTRFSRALGLRSMLDAIEKTNDVGNGQSKPDTFRPSVTASSTDNQATIMMSTLMVDHLTSLNVFFLSPHLLHFWAGPGAEGGLPGDYKDPSDDDDSDTLMN